MAEDILKKLRKAEDGLSTYEYIANNIGNCDELMPALVENMINVDRNGQVVVSTARYLHAIDAEKYADSIDLLVKAAIDKDREHKYVADGVGELKVVGRLYLVVNERCHRKILRSSQELGSNV